MLLSKYIGIEMLEFLRSKTQQIKMKLINGQKFSN